MPPRVYSIGLLVCILICIARSEYPKEELPSDLISICSDSGSKILAEERTAKKNYEPMLVQGTTQINNAFCGVASSVIAFNSITTLQPPIDERHEFPYWTQENFFSDEVSAIIEFENVSQHGIMLDQLGEMIDSWKYGEVYNSTETPKQIFYVSTVHTSDSDIGTFRSKAWEAIATQARVIVNFRRDLLGEQGEYGHFSPLVAFSPTVDMFLLYDVARYKFPCPTYWVPTEKLWNAMDSIDTTANKTRGYIIIDTDLSDEEALSEKGQKKERALIVIMGAVYIGVIGLALALFVVSIVGCIKRRKKKHIPVEEPSVNTV